MENIKQTIETLKKGLSNPHLSDEIKEEVRVKIAELESSMPKSMFEIGDIVLMSGSPYKVADKAYRNNIDNELTWVYYLPEYSSVMVSEKNLKPYTWQKSKTPTIDDLNKRLVIANKMAKKDPALKARVRIVKKIIEKAKRVVDEKPTQEKVIDVVDRFNRMELPQEIYSKGVLYNGSATFTNGYNGYTSSEQDGYLIDNDGNVLKDRSGNIIRAKERRGLTIDIQNKNNDFEEPIFDDDVTKYVVKIDKKELLNGQSFKNPNTGDISVFSHLDEDGYIVDNKKTTHVSSNVFIKPTEKTDLTGTTFDNGVTKYVVMNKYNNPKFPNTYLVNTYDVESGEKVMSGMIESVEDIEAMRKLYAESKKYNSDKTESIRAEKTINDEKEALKLKNTVNNNYIDFSGLSDMEKGRLISQLDKKWRIDGKIVSVGELINSGIFVSKSVYEETHAKRKVHLEYKELSKPKKIYTLWKSDESGYDVPKIIYDAVKLPLRDNTKSTEKDIVEDLKNFDLDSLDMIEQQDYAHFSKTMSKEEALQIIINTVEGDYTQLSPKLAKIARKQDGDSDSGSEYFYVLRSRPFSIGTHPTENFLRFEDNFMGTRYGAVVYSKPVPVSQMEKYEIQPYTEVVDLVGSHFNRKFGKSILLTKIKEVKIESNRFVVLLIDETFTDSNGKETTKESTINSLKFIKDLSSGDLSLVNTDSVVDKVVKNYGNIRFTIDSAKIEGGGTLYGGYIDVHNHVIKSFIYVYKSKDLVEKDMENYLRKIKSVTYHGSKGRESSEFPYLVFFNDGDENREVFKTAEEAKDFTQTLELIINKNNNKEIDNKSKSKSKIQVTSIKDIPNLEQKIQDGKVTYRGLGMGKLADDFYKLTGTGGSRIKVDGKEYFVTDEEFDSISRGADGKMRIRFDAPHRKYENGGLIDKYPNATEKSLKEIQFLLDKGYTIDVFSTKFSDVVFVTPDEKEIIFATQGSKDGKHAVAYLYEDEDSGEMVISRDLLKEINNEFMGGAVTLYTNAGVDLHTSENGKFKNIEVVKVSFDEDEFNDNPTGYCENATCRKAIYSGGDYCSDKCRGTHNYKEFKNGGKVSKAEIKRAIYKPTGDFFIDKEGNDVILHLTSKDASNLPKFLWDKYEVTDNGDGYYGASYRISKKGGSTYAKGGQIRKRRTNAELAQAKYNEEVDAYKWYLVNVKEKHVISGFEFKEDATDLLADYDGDKNYKIVSKRHLEIMGIKNPNEEWKKMEKGGKVKNQLTYHGKKIFDIENIKDYSRYKGKRVGKTIETTTYYTLKKGSNKKYYINDTLNRLSHFLNQNNLNKTEFYNLYPIKDYTNIDVIEYYENGGSVDNQHNYMLLDRMRSDNDYFLGNGNGYEGHLYSGSVKEQIKDMKELWNNLPENEKPEWLSMEDILEYETKMNDKLKSKMENGGEIEEFIIGEKYNRDSGMGGTYTFEYKGIKNDKLNFKNTMHKDYGGGEIETYTLQQAQKTFVPQFKNGGSTNNNTHVVVSKTKDDYWVVSSKPMVKAKAEQFKKLITPAKGETLHIETVEAVKNHKKVVGDEYLAKGGEVRTGIHDYIYLKGTRFEKNRGYTISDEKWNELLDKGILSSSEEGLSNDWRTAVKEENWDKYSRLMYSPKLDKLREQSENEFYVNKTYSKGGEVSGFKYKIGQEGMFKGGDYEVLGISKADGNYILGEAGDIFGETPLKKVSRTELEKNFTPFFKKGGSTWIQSATKQMEKKGTKGLFTKRAESRGLEPVEFAKKVLENPKRYTETIRKEAQFVKNTNPELFK